MTDREIIEVIKKKGKVKLREYTEAPMARKWDEEQECYYYDDAGRIVGLHLEGVETLSVELVSLIGKLKSLRQLALSATETADISSLHLLHELEVLELTWNEIKDISPLRGMTRMRELILTGNKITNISVLQYLQGLTSLSLDNNEIRNVSILSNLTALTKLWLGANHIKDARPLAGLKKLKTLHLFDNGIADISFLQEMVHLTDLDISANLCRDLSPLQHLQNLVHLDMSEIEAPDLHSLPLLNNLESIWLSGNGIADLSSLEKLASLPSLSELNLSNNSITDLAPLEKFTTLDDLNLSKNSISDISPVRNLHLRHLNLSSNRITELPEWLADGDMKILYSRKNQAGRHVSVYYNPIKTPPLEIVKKGTRAIKAWFGEGQREEAYVNEVKVLLVGNGNVGKTTLVKTLMGEKPDPGEPVTPNIQITVHAFPYNKKEVKLHFWDFGGQEVMHSTHQFFLSRRSVYILVLDGRRDDDAEYWLKHIESFGGDSPTLVVLNKMDANPGYEVDRRFLQTKYPFITGFYKTACLGVTAGIDEVKKGLGNALDKVEILSTPWPRSWLPVKEQLEGMKEDFISRGTYNDLCERNGIKEEEVRETLAGYLNDLGIIVHFSNELRLSDLHILQPRWVSRAAYKIINSRKVSGHQGLLKVEWMEELMRKENAGDYHYQKSTFPYILDLMRKFELCYAVKEDKEFLIPELMDIQQPELPEHTGPVLRFFFHYQELLPRSIMTRFIVRMHEDIKDNLRWRTGVVLEAPELKTMAIVIADAKEKKIHVSVSGRKSREHFAIIRKTFLSLRRDFEKLPVSEWVPLPDEDHYAVEYEELLGCEEAGDKEYKLYKIGKTYNVKKLLDGIEPESVRKEEYKWDIFLSYSSADAEVIRRVADDLKQRGITYWLDTEQLEPGDSIIDRIAEGAQNSRYMVPCISENQLQSSWSRKEYQSILHRIISGMKKQRLIPLVLDDTPDEKIPLFLGDLKCMRYRDKADYEELLDFLNR